MQWVYDEIWKKNEEYMPGMGQRLQNGEVRMRKTLSAFLEQPGKITLKEFLLPSIGHEDGSSIAPLNP